jgi:hypothetical protein
MLKIKIRSKWKFKIYGWSKFRQSLTTFSEDLPHDIHSLNEIITQNIYKTAEQVFGRTRGETNPNYNKPWCSPECKRATKARKRAKLIILRYPTEANADIMRRLDDEARKILKETKEGKRKEYANRITSYSPVGEVWSKIKKISYNFTPQNSPLLVGNNVYTDNAGKVAVFADYFAQAFQDKYTISAQERSDLEEELNHAMVDYADHINCPFAVQEMEVVIRDLRGNPTYLSKTYPNHTWTSYWIFTISVGKVAHSHPNGK